MTRKGMVGFTSSPQGKGLEVRGISLVVLELAPDGLHAFLA
jgi:hypothetical protein